MKTNIFKSLALLCGGLAIGSLWPSHAVNPKTTPGPTPGTGDGPGVTTETSGSGCEDEVSQTGSYFWRLSCGSGRWDNTLGLLAAYRDGVLNGGNFASPPAEFGKVFGILTKGSARSPVELRIEVPDIQPVFFTPNILRVSEGSNAEILRDATTHAVRQVVTRSRFTDVTVLPAGEGFQIRQWHRSQITLGVPAPFYPAPNPTTDPPLYDIVFKKHPTLTTGFHKISKEWRPGGDDHSVLTSFEESDHDPMSGLPDTYTIYHHEYDELTSTIGDLLRKTELVYPARGAKRWDYTVERKVWQAHTVGGVLTALDAINPAADTLIEHNLETYEDFSLSANGGEPGASRLVSRIHAYGSPVAERRSETWDFYRDINNPLIHGRLRQYSGFDDGWQYHTVSDGPVATTATFTRYSARNNVTVANRANALKEHTTFTSTYSQTTTTDKGKEIAKKEIAFAPDAGGFVEIITTRHTGAEQHTATARYYPSDYGTTVEEQRQGGRPHNRENEDGTVETWTYAHPAGAGMDGPMVVTHDHGAGTVAGVTMGTRTVRTYNVTDVLVSESVSDITPGTGVTLLSSWDGTFLDKGGRPTKITYNGVDNDYATRDFSCCAGSGSETRRDGTTIARQRDALDRVHTTTTTPGGDTATPIVRTTDFEGLTVTVNESAGSLDRLVSKRVKHLNRRLLSSTAPDSDGVAPADGETTTYAYGTDADGYFEVSATRPDGSVAKTAYYHDKRVRSVTGDVSALLRYEYRAHSDYEHRTYVYQLKTPTEVNPTEYYIDMHDGLGRRFKRRFGPASTSPSRDYTFHSPGGLLGSRGKLLTDTDPDGVTMSYFYDHAGRPDQTTQAMPNGAGNRTVVTSFGATNDPVIGPSRTTTRQVNGVTTSVATSSGDGFGSKGVSFGRTSTDVTNRTLPADGTWTVTRTAADDSYTVETYAETRLQRSEMFNADDVSITHTTYTYDAFGRLDTITDARTGTVTYSNYTDSGRARTVTDAGARVTALTYDALGRQVTSDREDTPLAGGGTSANITHTSYHPTGNIAGQWGDGTYARYHVYDSQSRMTAMRTFQGLAHGTEPDDTTGGYAETAWIYSGQRGWLVEKLQHGEVDDSAGDPDYTYTDAGRLKTRTWERGLHTRYDYHSLSGMLTGVNYFTTRGADTGTNGGNDPATPDTDYTYDSFGRPTDVDRGASGQLSYAYDPVDLVLDKETVTVGNLTRVIDRYQDALLRPSGYALGTATSPTADDQALYSYDTAGRFQRINHKKHHGKKAHSYGYAAGSAGLVASLHVGKHNGSSGFDGTFTRRLYWEPDRDALDRIGTHNFFGTNPATSFDHHDYTTNAIGQRSGTVTNGTFNPGTDGEWDWAYNARGELASADAAWDNTEDRFYQFDAIGNRAYVREGVPTDSGGTQVQYTADAKNQYTAAAGLSPVYDFDGNLTSGELPADPGNLATLDWDGENRLVKVTKDNGDIVEFTYDAYGRRTTKTVTPAGGSPTTTTFVHDGWNLIAEYTGAASPALVRTYLWGLDLSGGMGGAGGVGGLLSVREPGVGVFHPTYDGNGNVTGLLREHSGNPNTNGDGAIAVGSYRYNAFGETLSVTDHGSFTYASTNPFRFSTKYRDAETGLYYYGYRYYDPKSGRWPSRDPIGERGGLNLYGFVGNDGVNGTDVLGQRQHDAKTTFKETPGGKPEAGIAGSVRDPRPWEVNADMLGPTEGGHYILRVISARAAILVTELSDPGIKLHEDTHVNDWKGQWGALIAKANAVDGFTSCCPEPVQCRIDLLEIYRLLHLWQGRLLAHELHTQGRRVGTHIGSVKKS